MPDPGHSSVMFVANSLFLSSLFVFLGGFCNILYKAFYIRLTWDIVRLTISMKRLMKGQPLRQCDEAQNTMN